MKTHVVKTRENVTLSEVVDLMDIYQVSGIPVLDSDDRVCGMITERDVLQASLPSISGAPASHQGTAQTPLTGLLERTAGAALVKDWMTKPAILVTETTDIVEAASTLLNNGLKRLPVVTDDGLLVGTLNRVDVLQALFEGNLP